MQIDQVKLDAFMGQVVGELGSARNSALVLIGEKVGLYKAIAGAGGIESREVQIVPRLTVRLGGQSLVWRDLAIWPVSGYALTPLDGVLGADVLAVARLKLDPAAGRLILYPHLR